MKKTYINPTLKVVNIQPSQLMNPASLPQGDTYKENDLVLSRRARFSNWEDEEEEY